MLINIHLWILSLHNMLISSSSSYLILLYDLGLAQSSRGNDNSRSEWSRVAIGVMNSNGNPQNITPAVCLSMIRVSMSNRGHIPTPNEDEISNIKSLVSPLNLKESIFLAGETDFLQVSRRVPVIDLIISQGENGKRKNYLVRNVSANAFFRDVVNAALTRNILRVSGVERQTTESK